MRNTITKTELLIPAIYFSDGKKQRHAEERLGFVIPHEDWLKILKAREVSGERRQARSHQRPDPLVWARETRPGRTRTARQEMQEWLAQRAAERDAERAAYDLKLQYAAKAAEEAAKVHAVLLSAAREARKMGFSVRPSKSKSRRISSYYVRGRNMKLIRISDHELPDTPRRQLMREIHNQSEFAAEIIVEAGMTPTRIRRLLVLAEAGRRL